MYVVYFMDTTMLAVTHSFGIPKLFKTEGAAKAARTRFCRKTGCAVSELGVATAHAFYHVIEKHVERTNLMSGEKYREPINTPAHSSPATESYWSM